MLSAKAIYGLFEANTVNDDDIEVYFKGDETRNAETFMFRTLRQQSKKAEGRPNIALSDFIAPKETGIKDYIGCFA